MDRTPRRARTGLKLSSFPSINGATWVVSEGFCVLGYFKARAEARAEFKRRSSVAADSAASDPGQADPDQADPDSDYPSVADPDSPARPA